MATEVAAEAGALLVTLFLATSRLDAATEMLAALQATATQLGTPFALGLARSSAGRLAAAQGAYDTARVSVEAALEHFTQAGTPYERALTLLLLADTLEQAGPDRSDLGTELRIQANNLLRGLRAGQPAPGVA
jgi:hypothetical protein